MRLLDFLSPTRHCLGCSGWQQLQSLAVTLTFTSTSSTHFRGCPREERCADGQCLVPSLSAISKSVEIVEPGAQRRSGGQHKAMNFCSRRLRWQFQGHALRLRNRPIRRDTYELSSIYAYTRQKERPTMRSCSSSQRKLLSL